MENNLLELDKKNLSFEKALEKLEETVSKMESGKLPLDEMIKYFETGSKLSAYCEAKLKELEKKIEILVSGAKSDNPEWASFEVEEDTRNGTESVSERSASKKSKSVSSPESSTVAEDLPF